MLEQANPRLRNYRIICNVVLFGTYLAVAVFSALLIISYNVDPDTHTIGRLWVCAAAFVYVVVADVLLRLGRQRAMGYMLILFYLFLGGGIMWCWGINTPIGPLIYATLIVLSAILFTASHALVAAIVSILVLVGIQVVRQHITWTGGESGFGDVFAYSAVFCLLALISWLYTREMDRSLAQAQRAEAALLLQKATLKEKVKKRTEQLRQLQLKEVQQMYRFAELGQLGVTLLHDLANHLTALTLEIDGLQSTEHAKAIARAQKITDYLGKVVVNTRERLNGGTQELTFDIVQAVGEIVEFLNDKAEKAHVTVKWQPPTKSWLFAGDPISLNQVIGIILCNAIDASCASPSADRWVVVAIERDSKYITLRISNSGKQITKVMRKHLFAPFHSSKASGMGIGLFIAKQTVEMQFLGTLVLNLRSTNTEFVVRLPRRHEN